MTVSPIAIGGLGGSGTRVVASAVRHLGVRLGGRLNGYLDNLWFTALFKRRAWTKSCPKSSELLQAADIFIRAMTEGASNNLSPSEARLLRSLQSELPPHGSWVCGAQQVDVEDLMNSRRSANDLWGWKEPNTHIFLETLNTSAPNMRYIHVVRSGLDMAFSKNKWQARHWGYSFNLPFNNEQPEPEQQLRYWYAANLKALNFGEEVMGGRFLVICYDDLCANPLPQLERLQRFLEVDGPARWPNDMISPRSIGRSAMADLSQFSESDIKLTRDLMVRVRECRASV